jgi:hypothetical protein
MIGGLHTIAQGGFAGRFTIEPVNASFQHDS